MQKDVIYIDVEDDITAIIGKVKASSARIVALVPPKRLGAIQSAVNLKLVHRAAEQADKRLVIISNNPALVALAASAAIPVAKNLQSKPEVAEVSALEVDEGDDVIDGSEVQSKPTTPVSSIESTEAEPSTASTATRKSGAKIPNFDTFRKKLFFGIGGGILLIGFLVWALVFAPHATIIVTARTSTSALTTKVSVGDNLSTSLKDGTLKSVTKTLKKEVSVPVTATGAKNVGEKAKGTIKFTTNNPSGVSIPAGTTLTVAGMAFSLESAVNVPGATLSFGCGGICPGTANGVIVAPEGGQKYNGASGSATGAPSGVSAATVGSTSGGTDKTATVVQQSDVDAAMTDLVSSDVSNAAQDDLKDEFGGTYVVLTETFKKDTGEVKPNPAVDAEASDGKATLSGEVTFTLVAVSRSELSKLLDEYFAQQIDGKTDQKVYDNGVKSASFTGVSASDKGYSANIAANGKIGPKIDEEAIKNFAKGKRYGEIQSYIQDINGVDSVDVKFSPFWVQSAPNDTKRIEVEFKVNE
ncbi:MAG: hypothetical protein WBP12_05840 [Candidatus Saccharimonas sp.]